MTRVVSWKIARGARAWHLVHGLGAARTNCGVEIPSTRPHPQVALNLTWSAVPAVRPTEMCAACWSVSAAVSTHPLEDEPLAEAVRNALQRLALLPTAETLEQSDAILTDVKRRLTEALQREEVVHGA